jgi:small subunit ribosomal protein S6
MNKYEALFIIKPELSEEERKALFHQIQEAIVKNNGKVSGADIWSEKRKLYFPIKRHQEGVYYLANFSLPAEAVAKIREAYRINENILRVMISRLK